MAVEGSGKRIVGTLVLAMAVAVAGCDGGSPEEVEFEPPTGSFDVLTYNVAGLPPGPFRSQAGCRAVSADGMNSQSRMVPRLLAPSDHEPNLEIVTRLLPSALRRHGPGSVDVPIPELQLNPVLGLPILSSPGRTVSRESDRR